MPVSNNRYSAIDPQTVAAPLGCPAFQSTILLGTAHFRSTEFHSDFDGRPVGWIARAQTGTVVDFRFNISHPSGDHPILSVQNLDAVGTNSGIAPYRSLPMTKGIIQH